MLVMYLRTTTSRPRKDGSRVRYLALAHNEWDPDTRRSKAKVLYNFGREDQLDRDALTRLIASINRYLGVDDPPAAEPTQADTTAAAGTAEALGFVAGGEPRGGRRLRRGARCALNRAARP
jgi:hypothetical protein